MATTKIWAVKHSISKLVNYAVNPEKTSNDMNGIDLSFEDVSNVIDYATQDKKTEQALFVTGINCEPTIASKQMNRTHKRFDKLNGILAFHAYQSFKPGEINASDAHDVGIKLANELWGDRYEVVVATHTDKHHIHNHFVINNVSFIDGKKYPASKKTYRHMQDVSDRLCRERNLSVIEQKKGRGVNHKYYIDTKENKPTVRNLIKKDIDEAISYSRNFSEFVKNMKKNGYEVNNFNKYLKVKPEGKQRWFRCKTLGDNYTEDMIRQRISTNDYSIQIIKVDRKVFLNSSNKPKRKGIQALYYHYLYLMQIYPKPQSNKKMHFLLKEDIINLDDICEQTNYICKNDINSAYDLGKKIDDLYDKLDDLKDKRESVNSELSENPFNKEYLKDKRDVINKSIYDINHEIVLCNKVRTRSQKMEKNIKTVESQTVEKTQVIRESITN